jgi:hypothetical protein
MSFTSPIFHWFITFSLIARSPTLRGTVDQHDPLRDYRLARSRPLIRAMETQSQTREILHPDSGIVPTILATNSEQGGPETRTKPSLTSPQLIVARNRKDFAKLSHQHRVHRPPGKLLFGPITGTPPIELLKQATMEVTGVGFWDLRENGQTGVASIAPIRP